MRGSRRGGRGPRTALLAPSVFALVACLLLARSEAASFKQGDSVSMYANKVGPFNNPSETYQFYTLPFCEAEKQKYKLEYLGEVLEGDRLVNTPFDLSFLEDREDEKLCVKQLTCHQLSHLLQQRPQAPDQ